MMVFTRGTDYKYHMFAYAYGNDNVYIIHFSLVHCNGYQPLNNNIATREACFITAANLNWSVKKCAAFHLNSNGNGTIRR